MPTLLWANYDYDCIIIVAVFSWIIVLFYYCTVLFMLMMMLIKLYHINSIKYYRCFIDRLRRKVPDSADSARRVRADYVIIVVYRTIIQPGVR